MDVGEESRTGTSAAEASFSNEVNFNICINQPLFAKIRRDLVKFKNGP